MFPSRSNHKDGKATDETSHRPWHDRSPGEPDNRRARFILFLGHPLYAVAVVLAGFLVFAGIGSALAPRLDRRLGPGARFGAVEVAAVAIAVVALGYLAVLPLLFEALIWLPDGPKIAISLALIAPLALFMGMPFPLGIARVARAGPELVPWAWGINGCASMIAAILATVLAIHIGFAAVVMVAVILYLSTPFTLGRLTASTTGRGAHKT